MSDLADLAADLAYAAGPGARRIASAVSASAKLEAQTGVHLDLHPGPGITQAGDQRSREVTTPSVEPDLLAAHGATQAADAGAQLVKGHR